MNRFTVERVRELITEGRTNEEIAAILKAEDYDAECEAADAERFERDAYGIDDRSEDHRSYREQVMCDRLDMGRNDAGEWLGFM